MQLYIALHRINQTETLFSALQVQEKGKT